MTFSWIELFRASYFLNTLLKSGITLRITRNKPKPSTGTTNRKIAAILPPIPRSGMVTRKITASRPPMTKPMTKEKISISGQRMAMRIIII